MKHLKLFVNYNNLNETNSFIGKIGDSVIFSDDPNINTSTFHSDGIGGELEIIEDSEGIYIIEEIPICNIVFSNEKQIPSKRITIKGQPNILDAEDMEYIKGHIGDMMNDIDKLPFIIVIENVSGTYEIVDGMHRISAYNELGKTYIKAWVGKQRL